MENKIAIIKNNVVHSVIIATTEFGDTLSDTTVDVTSIECGIGWLYDGTSFAAPVKSQEEIKAEARQWRDNELQSTDYIVPLTDHPDHAATITYRQELRDWPSTDAFPDTKPTKA
mgnify:CR=1 FL=1|tara:strand:+ start:907 stop:1251 length:345 start_codon:yes stop_codon:yes gene_type:complete